MIAVGQTIGNYTITAKLGEGGMGVVYLAEHPVIGRKVALKAIHPELSRNPEVVSRFITEAKSVNQIGNEHIVDIHDFGNTSDGEFYFIMEFLQGESLADKLKNERVIPAARALQIAAQVADALAASHGHGIIHRDLKPENIFLINRGSNVDFVKVLDFGLAKFTLGEEKVTHKTRTGSVMGTPYYMAPEQCEGKASIDQRADLYSLGVILFEMMTGQVPFGGDGYGEIIVKHITMPPPSPRSINPQLTNAHEALLMRALAKSKEDRFQRMEDFRTAMLDPERYLATAPPLPRMSAYSGGLAPRSDNQVSGHVVFGAADSSAVTGHPGPVPSTFRSGVGELLDEDFPVVRKSRRGIIAGAVVAVLTAGAGGYFLYSQREGSSVEPPVTAPAPVPVPSPPVTPPAPQKTVIKFDSRPQIANVLRKDTGAVVGVTPFELSVPFGKQAIEFVFQKPGFEEASMTLTPEAPSAVLAATLIPARPVEPEKPSVKNVAARPARPKATPTKPKKANRPLNDEDGVLEPSFK
jgi:serine/threonine-protein kinase